MIRRAPFAPLAGIAFAVVAAAALLAGCGTKGALSPNLPPETVVFVSGPVDTVNHVVRLRWLGTDPDGSVARYEFKWIYEAGQEPAGYDSTLWTSTTKTDSTFRVYTPNGASMPTFVVRAIDDDDQADPTPARQTFSFKNDPPTVAFTGFPVLPATTLPVVTITWTASDPDGDIRLAHYLVWLDGDEASAAVVPGVMTYTIPPSAFSDGSGGYVTGPHKVFVRAIDDGGAASPADSFAWNVSAPVGDVLLIDDLPANQSAAADPMYIQALNAQVGPTGYTKVDVEAANPFRSSADLTYAFGFFRSVVWYQENSVVRSGLLSEAEDAIRTHLAAGGNVYVCSQTLVGSNGAITNPAFLEEMVGADSLRLNRRPDPPTTNFSIPNGAVIYAGASVPYDSLRALAIATNVDALALKVLNDEAYHALPIVLDSSQTEPWSIGVDRVPAGGSGRFVYLAFPLRILGGTPAGAPSPSPDANYGVRTLRKILARFGHGAPP